MNLLKKALSRLRGLRDKARLDAEMDAEMHSHIEMRTRENIAAGMDSDEARFAALRQFGWAESIKEECRDGRGVRWLEDFVHDLRHGARQLRKNPGFAFAAILTLALGIGANTAIFSAVHAILLSPPPYDDPGRLVRIFGSNPKHGITQGPLSRPDFADWQVECGSFAQMATFHTEFVNLAGEGEPERLEATRASTGFFETLRINPLLGRTFAPGEDRGGKVVVLSHRLWLRRFQGDRSIIGKTVLLNLAGHTVVGVLPASFRFPGDADLWLPLGDFKMSERGSRFLSAIGRLKPGVGVEQARAELRLAAGRIEARNEGSGGWGAEVVSLRESLTRGVRPTLALLSGAVAMVLLIACVNVAALLLARGVSRAREFSIRSAVGATRSVIVRQVMAECLLLAFLGGGLGTLLAAWGGRILRLAAVAQMPRTGDIALDPAVLACAVAASILSGVFFGILPALQVARADSNAGLKGGGRGTTNGGHRWSGVLAAAQIALSLVLLVGAGLLLRSLGRLRAVPSGFEAANVLTLRLHLPENKYATEEQKAAFAASAVGRVASIPGVASAAIAPTLPVSGGLNSYGFNIVGGGAATPGADVSAEKDAVTPDYFRTLGIKVSRGRLIDARDLAGSPPVLLVNETAARRFFGREDPIGRRITFGSDKVWSIIGVVADVRQYSLSQAAPPHFYSSLAQDPQDDLVLFVRAASHPAALAAAARDALRAVDPMLPVSQIQTLDEVVNASLSERRFTIMLLGCFAGSALLLSCVGLYGAVAGVTGRRRREMGVRLALGAVKGDVFRLVVRHGLKLALAGLAAGFLAALPLGRAMRSLLFETAPDDPLTFAGVAALLLVVTVLACWLPARRAANFDPVELLKSE